MWCAVCQQRPGPGTRVAIGDRCACLSGAFLDRPLVEPDPDAPLVGSIIDDRFALVGVLGTGGFGVVYRAIEHPVRRPVALKVLHAHQSLRPGVRSRFFREAEALARLSAAEIVKLIRFGEHHAPGGPPLLFIAQEFIAGRTLCDVLSSVGRLSPDRACRIAAKVLRALVHAHEQGVIHRDLKPENIMLVRDSVGEESVKVLDFGIAKVLRSQADGDMTDTRQGMVIGTPSYMSPDVARNIGVSPASDLYSLGVILYEMLSGTRPFVRETPFLTITAHCVDPVPPLPASPGVDPRLEALVYRALSKDPADRPASARAMYQTLRAIAGPARPIEAPADAGAGMSGAAVARRPSAPERTSTEMRGERTAVEPPSRSPVALFGALVGVGVLLGAGALWVQGEDRPAPVGTAASGAVETPAPEPVLLFDEPVTIDGEQIAAGEAMPAPDEHAEPADAGPPDATPTDAASGSGRARQRKPPPRIERNPRPRPTAAEPDAPLRAPVEPPIAEPKAPDPSGPILITPL